jgi:hypothetical protein
MCLSHLKFDVELMFGFAFQDEKYLKNGLRRRVKRTEATPASNTKPTETPASTDSTTSQFGTTQASKQLVYFQFKK